MAEGLIEGLLKLLLLWFVIVVAGVFVAKSIKRSAWRAAILTLSIGSVPLYVAFETSKVGQSFHAEREASKYNSETQAFEAYCVGRKRSVGRAESPMDTSIEVVSTGASQFEIPASFNAGELANSFTSKGAFARQLCSKTRLKYIEGYGVYSGPKPQRFPLCPTTTTPDGKPHPGYFPPEPIENSSAPYKLVFGPKSAPSANPVLPQRPFTRIQIQIVDVATTKTIAEDTLFFLGPIGSGSGNCPDGIVQVHELLLSAFAIN
jgi:hypothetical protein